MTPAAGTVVVVQFALRVVHVPRVSGRIVKSKMGPWSQYEAAVDRRRETEGVLPRSMRQAVIEAKGSRVFTLSCFLQPTGAPTLCGEPIVNCAGEMMIPWPASVAIN